MRDLFAAYGSVQTVTIVRDRDTHGPRGIAFIEMNDAAEANSAIKSLDGFRLNQRALRLNEARDKQPESRSDSLREHRRHRM